MVKHTSGELIAPWTDGTGISLTATPKMHYEKLAESLILCSAAKLLVGQHSLKRQLQSSALA
ncbi:unnamed protein product [Fusarium graminearum]|nr:unnamed protein product [Fusarium graminearum]